MASKINKCLYNFAGYIIEAFALRNVLIAS